jgi:hypothetical protein
MKEKKYLPALEYQGLKRFWTSIAATFGQTTLRLTTISQLLAKHEWEL